MRNIEGRISTLLKLVASHKKLENTLASKKRKVHEPIFATHIAFANRQNIIHRAVHFPDQVPPHF